MITLTVCNHKGGTGKTTSAIHLAAAFGLSGRRTLVVDLDPQGFLTRTLGVEEPPVEASSLMLFNHEVDVREVPVCKLPGFDLLPSSSVLTKEMRRLNKPTDVFWAKESVEMGLPYDVVLFDTAAAVTVYSLNALVASAHVLIPVTPEYQPVIGSEQTFQTVQMVRDRLNPSLNEALFLLTQVDGRKNTHHMYRSYLRNKYGEQILKTIIRTSSVLADMRADGTTAFDHDPYSRGARDYANAADELLRRIAPDMLEAGAAPEVSAEAEDTTEENEGPVAERSWFSMRDVGS